MENRGRRAGSMSFIDKLKFWKHEEPPEDWMSGLGEPESTFPTGGGPPFPTGLAPSTISNDFGSLAQGPTSIGHEQATLTPVSPPYQIVQPQPLYQQVQPPMNKEMEILSLKLDAIKNILDTINMRLERLEHITRGERAFSDRDFKY